MPKPTPVWISTRSYKHYDAAKFANDISKVPWDVIGLFDELEDKVDCFNQLFTDQLDQHAPIKTLRVKNTATPFITAEIKALMKQRDNQHKIARQTANSRDWEAYRVLRREVKGKIRYEETEYVRNEINTTNRTAHRSGKQSDVALTLVARHDYPTRATAMN